MDRFVVLIPAYNAADSLPDILRLLDGEFQPVNVLVVDDGSTDSTGSRARELGATVIRHDWNRGKGAALSTGFRSILLRKDIDAVVTVDADLQHDVRDMGKFLAARKGGANIVLGRRKRIGSGMPLSRIVSNAVTSFLVSSRTGVSIPDSQCGYRLLGREVLERVVVDADGYEAETELLIKAAALGFRIDWVPVNTVYRGETSHMTHWRTTKQFIRTLLKEY